MFLSFYGFVYKKEADNYRNTLIMDNESDGRVLS
jgi:hypothetical protein